MKPKTQRFAASSAALFIVLVASPLASAASGTWTQLNTGGLWSAGGNWSGGTVADGSGSTANFSTLNLAADNTVKMDGSHILTALTFQDTTTPFFKWTLDNNGNAANVLTLAGTTPSITVGASTTATISAEIAGSTNWSKAGAGTLILTGNNTTTGNVSVGGGTGSVLSFNTIADKNVSSALGAGTTITVTASNSSLTYTGGVASSNRDFVLGNSKALFSNTGGGLLTLSGGISTTGTVGSLQLRSGNVELSGVFTGLGFASVNSSSSTLTLSNAANDFTNPLDIFSGTISVNSIADQGVASAAGKGTTINIAGSTNAGKLIYTGGASTNTRIIGLFGTTGTATIDQSGAGLLKFTSDMTNPGSAGVANAKTFTLQGSTAGTGEFGGKIIDALAGTTTATSVTKAGTGTWTLSGNNTYSGLTTVNDGVLQVANNNGLGGTAAGTVVNGTNNGFVGTVLDLNGVSIGSGESLTMASGGTASARVSLRTVGTTTNTWAGGVSLTGSKAVQFFANTGGQLEISGAITHSSFTGTMTLRGGGTGILSGGVTLSGTTDITVNDGGTWNVNTTGNTWGNTNAYRGTLVLGANDALPTTTSLNLGGDANSGTLKLNGKSQTVAGLTTAGSGTANKVVGGNATAGALTVNNSTANAFAGVLGGTGTDENNFSLTKDGAGTLTLSGASTYTGATLVSGGTLLVTGALASNISVSDNATIGGGGTVGAVSFGGGSFFDIFLAMSNPLDSTTISFSTIGFGIDNLLSQGAAVDWSIIADGTYTLINGTLSNTNLGNFGLANAYDLGSGRSAYFKNGSLQLVVIPEPAAALLGGLGLLTLLRRRR
jgi:autotransporter-associated beta strand protein